MRLSPISQLILAATITGLIVPVKGVAQQRNGADRRAAADTVRQRMLPANLAGAGVTHADVVQRLERSGMSRSQVRAGLLRLGYDPGLADAYFDVVEGRRAVPEGEADRRFIDALTALGVPAVAHADELTVTSPWATDTLAADSLADANLPRLFGLDLFRRFTTQFDAPLDGPVDPGYRLGAGDELSLVLTGEVEAAIPLEVTREGFIIIPDAGQVFVSGLTMKELEDRLYGVLGRHYSGVRRGVDAPIQFHVGLRRLRASAVYVIGEAVRPGAYQVSSVATVLNALYLAGGPADRASFRAVQVRRAGKVVSTLDLYDYLLQGRTGDDVRLEHGDVIFLPVTGPRVTIEGAVRRPAIYELRASDGLAGAVAYAGGLSSAAGSHRIQIDRILPPDQRQPGIDRVLVDVDAAALARGDAIELRDGDVIRVFEVNADRRNRVVLTGEVNRPGVYEWRSGLTLADLLERADGPSERAYVARTHIFRLNPRDGSRHLLRVDPAAFALTPLMDRDSVVFYNLTELGTPRFVRIDGFVKKPGTYELAAGMTLQDLILAAGGFAHGAWTVEAELARMPSTAADGPDPGELLHVRLGGRADAASAGVVDWAPDATELRLQHGDRVFVRKAPEYELPQSVVLAGEVAFPGIYALTAADVRLSDLLKRAGGLKAEAHAGGAQLVRGGHLVATNLDEALRAPGSTQDIELLSGDSIFVPRLDATVLVRGAVGFETRVRFEAGRNLDFYVERAGGYADNADRGRVTVTEQNGERKIVRLRRLVFDSKPEPGPGSTIFVPGRPASSSGGINWDSVLTKIVGIASATATVLIAVDRAK
jgi:protein involved in polysaccharide export with SLBB domain